MSVSVIHCLASGFVVVVVIHMLRWNAAAVINHLVFKTVDFSNPSQAVKTVITC